MIGGTLGSHVAKLLADSGPLLLRLIQHAAVIPPWSAPQKAQSLAKKFRSLHDKSHLYEASGKLFAKVPEVLYQQ